MFDIAKDMEMALYSDATSKVYHFSQQLNINTHAFSFHRQ